MVVHVKLLPYYCFTGIFGKVLPEQQVIIEGGAALLRCISDRSVTWIHNGLH